jgi:hypothetical protein
MMMVMMICDISRCLFDDDDDHDDGGDDDDV